MTVVAFLSSTCNPCVELVPHLNRLAKAVPEVPFIVVTTDADGFDYSAELIQQVMVVGDPENELQKAYEVERTPLVYGIDAEGKVAMRSIANDLLDLEDTLDGIGWPQGGMPWVRSEETPMEEA